MLARIDRKDLAERAKRMRVAAQAPQDLKLKAPVITVSTLTENDKETTSGLVFKRRRKTILAPTKHSQSDGRAPFNHASPPSPNPSCHLILV